MLLLELTIVFDIVLVDVIFDNRLKGVDDDPLERTGKHVFSSGRQNGLVGLVDKPGVDDAFKNKSKYEELEECG